MLHKRCPILQLQDFYNPQVEGNSLRTVNAKDRTEVKRDRFDSSQLFRSFVVEGFQRNPPQAGKASCGHPSSLPSF